MAHVAYLTLSGEKQGLISSGCNTKDSMGNRYQYMVSGQ
ncbi:Major exported protein [Vibrio aerogenes CECT 7868]|uniref:Major exported protein n=1 Tax=Vibrio aerogenes CECT 7868 TaxID=1216006 RepID=A0A1M6A7C2_9VIBR|nr:Major exported protein [Vibrio aerogenes CECT 7868]